MVSVVPKNSLGNALGSGQTVSVSDGSSTVNAVWNSSNSNYEASFTENTTGTVTFTATVDGTTLNTKPNVLVYQMVATVSVGSTPFGITYGNGNVYVSNEGSNTVSVIDAGTVYGKIKVEQIGS